MSVQIRTLLRSEMLAPAGKPAANKIGRDVEGCMTAAISTMSSPPGVVMSGTWEVVCVVSPPVASGCIVFVCFVGGVEAAVVSSRLAAEVDRCCTTDTSPATVSLSDCMSSAMLFCGLSAARLELDSDTAAAGGGLVRRGCFRFAEILVVHSLDGWWMADLPRPRLAGGFPDMVWSEADRSTGRGMCVCNDMRLIIILSMHTL